MAFFDLALGALLVLAATSAGALLVLMLRKINKPGYSAMLAFAAGMMAFSAIEMLGQSHSSGDDATVLAGLALGVLALFLSDRLLPHVHRHALGEDIKESKKKMVLIVGTIALHNIPEGFAIAAAFAQSNVLGWFVAASIAVQDFPEGALVSTPLAAYGMERKRSAGYGILSGAIEAGAAVAGYLFLSAAQGLVPLALSFSAGAMGYVVMSELLPDASEGGMERVAALSFLAGAALSFALSGLFP
jgi:zinc transporter, ZIP family